MPEKRLLKCITLSKHQSEVELIGRQKLRFETLQFAEIDHASIL